MKKILIIAVSALTTLLASCNMDKFPHSAILESEGVKTMEDATAFRVGLYTPMKALLGGARYTMEEIRGGMLHAMIDFGNDGGVFYRWEMQSTETNAQSLWYGDYAGIVSVNYTIEAYKKLIAEAAFDKEDLDLLENYLAEAYVCRALLYWDLVTKFCPAYDPVTYGAGTDFMGLPLQTTYNPTSDVTKYPGRSSLKATYDLILGDLANALDLDEVGKYNSNYYTRDLVMALMARVYLNMQDWENAAHYAQSVIDSGRYELADDEAEIESLFSLDSSKEIIFVVKVTDMDPPTSTGSVYIHDTENGDGSTPDPHYIPSKTLLDLYGTTPEARAKDLRYPIFFQTHKIAAQGAGEADLELLWKFVGNPELQTVSNKINYLNAGKIRLAEMYLTLAEAYANMGDTYFSLAETALNDLRKARVSGFGGQSYTNIEGLMPAIKAEWSREFIGEGFRLINLKRWKDDLVFGTPQNVNMVYLQDNLSSLNKEISHSRAIWPIPKVEMDINPQLKGQQNPGY